jgi:hypothetical protein
MCRLIVHQQNIIIIITLTNAAAILDLFPWVILPFFLFDEGLGPMQLRVCGTQAHMNRPTTPRFRPLRRLNLTFPNESSVALPFHHFLFVCEAKFDDGL